MLTWIEPSGPPDANSTSSMNLDFIKVLLAVSVNPLTSISHSPLFERLELDIEVAVIFGHNLETTAIDESLARSVLAHNFGKGPKWRSVARGGGPVVVKGGE